jgi:hypothetical protein
MQIPPEFLLLLPLSAAAGLDLYLTLLLVSGATLVGQGMPHETLLPSSVGGPLVVGLAGLYALEAVVELRVFFSFLWHNLQLVLRPLGAGLLALLLLQGETSVFVFLGAAMATTVAAFSHVQFWGRTIVLRLTGRPPLSRFVHNLAADLVVIILVELALLRPDPAILLATVLLGAGLVLGGGHHGAARLGLSLLFDRVWGIVSPTDWRTSDQLPGWIGTGTGQIVPEGDRGARAGSWGVVGPGRFREGWILQRNQDLLFVRRRGRTAAMFRIEGVQDGVEFGPLWKTVRYRSEEGIPSALFLQMGLNGPESHK